MPFVVLKQVNPLVLKLFNLDLQVAFWLIFCVLGCEVSCGQWHRANCFWTWLQHSSLLDQAYKKDFRRSCLASFS